MHAKSQPTMDYPPGVQVPTFQGIQEAYKRLQPVVNRTPLLTSRTLNERATQAFRLACQGRGGDDGKTRIIQDSNDVQGGTDHQDVKIEVALKCENFQKVGAFKYRGASNALLKHIDKLRSGSDSNQDPKELWVFTHSSGNFAQAIACSAKNLSTPSLLVHATIIMPHTAPPSKRAGVIEYGAKVVGCENAKRAEVCEEEMSKARAEGKTVLFLPSYDHVDVIEGHGGLMLEVETQCKSSSVWGQAGKPDVILCPIGGGGLISGVSLGAKGVYGDEMVVIGVEPSGADDTYRSLHSGDWQPAVNPTKTICDGLLTATGFLTLPTIKQNVNEIVLVDDEATIRAMRFVWERMKIIVEPSSAMTLAAILGQSSISDSASTVWHRIVYDTLARRQQRRRERADHHYTRRTNEPDRSNTDQEEDDDKIFRACVIVGGGNVSFEKVFEWFRGHD
ncbi:tryptophan synthase beta subunit-like PLP-dependent enzyme [Filobasidium floriforme]|uniref:tryptophan synthase beta subunit-like PLP-dependent enzyme n=1 Tax=Filobasidium floriforme TaxID=5210 RepID=UPI001E8EE5D6|nr:tryptophan synthase beta subunit-like PLP-dependent enzyme [Filobasidium floriforme]KAH8079974.1 tryptophan synthase beta subunit-like PLP-dependent enzyme [Filobasidium floriforme]